MFINCYDRLHCMLAKAIAYVHGTIDSESDWDNFEQAIMWEDYSKKISSLNNIKGIRAVSAIDISIDEEFLSGDRWFTETVQANKSCAVLYTSDLDKAVLVIFYDKECDFFIVEVRNPAEFLDQGYNQTLYYWVKQGSPISQLPCYEEPGYQFEGYFDIETGEPVKDGTIIERDRVIEGVWIQEGIGE